MRYDYVSVGFYTFDCLGRPVTDLPIGGDCHFIDELTLAVSGAAGSAAIVAAKYGLSCLAVGGLGDDMMGDWVAGRLAHFGVDISAMQRRKGWKTSSSIVPIRTDGTRPTWHMKGATGDFELDETLIAQVLDTRVLHLGGVGLMDKMDGQPNIELMARAKQKGCITTVDIFAGTAEQLPLIEGLLPHTDYFMPSIEEGQAISSLRHHEDVAKFFIDKGASCCLLTLGEEGAYYHHVDGTRFKLPAFYVDVICTCGCGDVFNAGFATALLKGLDPETAVRLAQATSALNATGLGSQAGVWSYTHTVSMMETMQAKTTV